MEEIKTRALTYSLLAHIRNSGKLASSPMQIFVPLVKRALSKMNEEGTYSGKTILEIKNRTDQLYGIDFPIPVLRTLLGLVAREVNTLDEVKFFLHQDDSFQIINYAFVEFEDIIQHYNTELIRLNKLFADFCNTCGYEVKEHSLLDFIEKNKLSLSKYLAHKMPENGHDFTVEARFVGYFRQIAPVYEIIRKIYLGSILSGFIEYKTNIQKTNVELVLDTNFILGYLDLNTAESTHTCKKIIEITQKQGYSITILNDTLLEAKALLKGKAENFDMTFLQRKVYPEDVYNACERRNLNRADLERIADNLEDTVSQLGVIISDTKKYRNIAKNSDEYETLKKIRYNSHAALHDAITIYYVREKRKKKIKEFEDVNCWVLNNSINRDKFSVAKGNFVEYQPEMIKADDFLNILWLSTPQISKDVDLNEVSDIGLTSLISLGLTESLPKLSVIRELDDNIHKYASDNSLTDRDIVMIATRITNKQLNDIEALNQLAKADKELFVKRLSEEANKQNEAEQERIRRLEEVMQNFNKKIDQVGKIKIDLDNKSKQIDEKTTQIFNDNALKDNRIYELERQVKETETAKKIAENRLREKRIEEYLENELVKWRRSTNYWLLAWCVIMLIGVSYAFYLCHWDLQTLKVEFEHMKMNILFSGALTVIGFGFTSITFRKWYDKNHNFSNIENYKKGIKLPESLR